MTEAEFERRQGGGDPAEETAPDDGETAARSASASASASTAATVAASPTTGNGRSRSSRSKPSKVRRVQRMFAVEEDLDKKLWLYAIHIGKDRSDVINDLLRPLVQSMVLYDSRDRRSGRSTENSAEESGQGD
jgi:hypothetical protein